MKDKHFVVTGGANGIGAETCGLLRDAGARLTILDIRKPDHPVDRYLPLDLNDLGSIDRAVAAIETPVDALLNIAGLPPRPGLASTVLRVNFFGLRRLTLGLLPRMVEGGAIVNVASRAGAQWREHIAQVKAMMVLADDADLDDFCREQAIDDTRAYNLSKEAVLVWTMAQTESLISRGLRMNTVSPGAVTTGILDDFKTAFGERTVAMLKRVGRPAHPAEVGQLIVFLTSPASAWLKGVDVPIDGGIGALGASDALGLGA
ncbi:coniferyl-alcohol dehydrogenase [Betaproteobacteria bacterium LSUCC0117]|nr:coniferyl-alcohol dehydrogenase [Betaproteobacteria bacterium LSUCC0117]